MTLFPQMHVGFENGAEIFASAGEQGFYRLRGQFHSFRNILIAHIFKFVQQYGNPLAVIQCR